MSNSLTPGNGGLPAPAPSDQQAVPPGGNQLAGPPPGPSQMQQHFSSAEDAAAAKFGKLKEAKAKMDVTLKEFGKLTALGDTVDMDDLMEAASGMVAAGVPAVAIASMLAEAPEQQSQLQAWVAEQLAKIEPQAQQLDQAFSGAGYDLGLTAMKSIMASSAEDHFAKRALALMPIAGRA